MAQDNKEMSIGFISTTRRVTVYKYDCPGESGELHKKEDCEATFHQFGLDCDLDECCSFSTAIIELDDGTVRNICVELIKFNDRDGK